MKPAPAEDCCANKEGEIIAVPTMAALPETNLLLVNLQWFIDVPFRKSL